MDKGSILLLGLNKIWVCSPQFAYIYYTHFILYKTKFKRVPWVGLQYVNVAFLVLLNYFLQFAWLFNIHIAVFRFLPMVLNDKHAIYIDLISIIYLK